MSVPHRWALGLFGAIFALTWYHPIWPWEQAMHHSLTLLAVGGLVWAQRRWPMPLWAFVFVLVFLTLHTIAARWIYSYVPYPFWTPGERNHFDRLVHFSYGLLIAPVIARRWGFLLAVQAILATGALYELLEWGLAMMLAPEAAEAYNGQQGDPFDPQKDQAFAFAGAVLGAGLRALLKRQGLGWRS
jgi:putative membrane protein